MANQCSRTALHRARCNRGAAARAMWAAAFGAAMSCATTTVMADEGGVGFWTPGLFGSMAAAPAAPGWSLGAIYYHTSTSADRSTEFRFGRRIAAGIDADVDVLFVAPTYAFTQPVLGAQAAFGIMAGVGHSKVSAQATFTPALGPSVSFADSDSLTAGTDLYALGTLKWARGEHNAMAYMLTGAPVGAYNANRLSNLGTNHWSIDAGGGYTYLGAQNGREFSIVAGLTYNFENPDTDYRNGIDGHIDWAASQFLSERLHAGAVGYFYHQLSGDSGAGAVLGDFKSRTNAIGPQVGYFFPFQGGKAYVNLKAYWEFGASHRPDGWNLWLTLGLPLSSALK